MSEKTRLLPEKDHTSRTEQDDANNDAQGTSPSTNGTKATSVTMSRWRKISFTVMTLLAYMSLNAGISMITPFYAIVAHQHHVTTYVSGFVIGTAPLCVAVMSPLIGYFLPHLGVKFTQLGGLLWGGGALFLFGFVSIMPTPMLFTVFSFLLRVVEGTGTAMYTTVSYTLLTQFYPEKKGTIVALLQATYAMGYSVGPAIGGELQDVGGFLLPFLVVGGCIFVLLVPFMILIPPTDCVSQKVLPWRLLLKLSSNITFVLIVLSLMLLRTAMCAVFAYFGHYLYTKFRLRFGLIGLVYFGLTATYGIGTVVAGPITAKLNIPRCLIVAGLVISAAAYVFLGPQKFITSPKLWLSILSWITLGIARAISIVPFYSDMHRIAKKLHEDEAAIASTVSGILVGAISGGQFLGPIIAGALVYEVGFQWMTGIMCLMLLICALVLTVATVIQRVWNSFCRTEMKHNDDNA